MSPREQNARTVIARLQDYSTRMTAMMDLLEGKNHLTAPEKSHLQQLLKSLKTDLKTDAHSVSTVGGESQLTPIEKAYFAPAVTKASAYLSVATNSHPIKSRWFSELYGVRIDIEHLLSQLKSQFPD